jgi:hypothetical protein
MVMSALPPKADMCGATSDVGYAPKADMPNVRVIISLFKPIRINGG